MSIPTQFLDEASIPAVPGVGDLPKADELVDSYFEFAGKLAEANRAFAKDLFAVWAPEAEKVEKVAKSEKK